MSDLAAKLAQFTGTDYWYRHNLVRWVTFTDGVKCFAEEAQAYWFLDIVATELGTYARKSGFLSIRLGVSNSKAEILADTGDEEIVFRRLIDYTDCPAGLWKFYMAPGGPENTVVIMLPSEY